VYEIYWSECCEFYNSVWNFVPSTSPLETSIDTKVHKTTYSKEGSKIEDNNKKIAGQNVRLRVVR